MDVGVYSYPHGDPLLIDKIVNEFLSQGKFDKLRKECMSDADTKPAYQNLQQRVENTVTQFLKKQVWRPDLNKNQLRDSLRKHILESKFFDAGINRIVDQVVNPNVLATVFLPEVEEVVYNYLSIPRPSEKFQKRGPLDERFRPGRDYEYKTSQINERLEKHGGEKPDGYGELKSEHNLEDGDHKPKDPVEKKLNKDNESLINDTIKSEATNEKGKLEEKIKLEPEDATQPQILTPVEKMEIVSDESQESLSRMGVESLQINEAEAPPAPDSDDSVPLEINEKSMSESRDSEDSIMNQMSPISQGRLTPDLEEELPEKKPEEKSVEKEEVKKPLTFIGRIPKIKREDSDSSKSSKTKEDIQKKDKIDVKNVYSSDESDSSKSYGKSDSDEKKRKNEKSDKDDKKREDSEKRQRERKRESSRERRRDRSRDRHKDYKRERSRERHKKSSSSSSSSQRERSSSHHKSSHRHKDSKPRRKEEEKKKTKSTDDHGKEKNKKEDRRSTDRDSNERERGRSSGSRTDGESRKREKEQHKAEDSREESNQKEETEVVEKEGEVVPELEGVPTEAGGPPGEFTVIEMEVHSEAPTEEAGIPPKDDSDLSVLDFNELFRSGAISRLEFPKLTDDFYVKFNSTGFRYFEEWEKAKLDCEEEFKEFVDEAENDLSLISDDESELEPDFNFDEENQKTITNLLKGLGNFRRSLMFDPGTFEFYKWTNNKFYQKFRKKEEKREKRITEKHESDESIKENIDRGGRNIALHLKLLNKYRRKAMRMGRPRRRHRRPESQGIKEKNENQRTAGRKFFNGVDNPETFITSKVIKLPDCNLVDSENQIVPDTMNSLNDIYTNETVTLPESPVENEEWSDAQNANKEEKAERRKAERQKQASNTRESKLPQSLPLNLPPSPDSDDVNSNGVSHKNVTVPRKRINQVVEENGTPRKQTRRNYSQKYDSQDLYKPRPVLNGSRTRGRERGLERDIVSLDSPVSR